MLSLFLLGSTDHERTSRFTSPVSSLLFVTLWLHILQRLTLGHSVMHILPFSVEKCAELKLLERVSSLYVGFREMDVHILSAAFLNVWQDRNAEFENSVVSFIPYWGGFLLWASAALKMGISGSSNDLLSDHSLLEAVIIEMFFFYWLCRGWITHSLGM